MSRYENKKFQTFKELVDIRMIIKETCEIIDFQITAKSLKLSINIDRDIPDKIETDAKRYR